MTTHSSEIIYTITDEAPALATYSLLPIVQAITHQAGIRISTKDISLAGRILANFADVLTVEQRQADDLQELGNLCTRPEANIIKLPNISASVPQLVSAIKELQAQGYALPDYPAQPCNDTEKSIKERYAKILGSAVNPVLREGNSDRRVAGPVKAYAKNHPHSMGAWSKNSRSFVAHMNEGDFYGSEQSRIIPEATQVRIEHISHDGQLSVLKDKLSLTAQEIIDASVMSVSALRDFYQIQTQTAKDKNLLLSLHLKATMMKVSDPIMFGHAVSVFYAPALEKHQTTLNALGVNLNNGIGDVYAKIAGLPEAERNAIEADLAACYQTQASVAMVDSDKGITNFHVPSNIIVDASMPAAIRSSGQMWNAQGQQQDTLFMIPDRCYAGIYAETIEFCKEHGAFDPATMGTVPNVGLMAQAAEEYGSHNKTFEMSSAGVVRVIDTQTQHILMQHHVEAGDIWRMCQTKEIAVQDWVKLAVTRARLTQTPAVFWLDPHRAHDAHLINLVKIYLSQLDTQGLDIQILDPKSAVRLSLERSKAGLDTISVTGNVLRDYLTDLFPILELGTSAKMLSIVPLLAGGGLFETGAGGSAPKHVQQFIEEGFLRWDSLGEFLALAVSLEDLAHKSNNPRIAVMAACLNEANGRFLDEDKSPGRKLGQLDNRGSHFYLALYWCEALAQQSQDTKLAHQFTDLAKALRAQESVIVAELIAAQGQALDLGGYYHANAELVAKAMRPSATFNALLAQLA
ncbi:MAG: NADP-dependent isocitrate dehydrogenase [Gammaproteobacteria bacterium]|nr:NADP-dependent isocitrate dehydrogenase [Gammaproteobacteria bacterium]